MYLNYPSFDSSFLDLNNLKQKDIFKSNSILAWEYYINENYNLCNSDTLNFNIYAYILNIIKYFKDTKTKKLKNNYLILSTTTDNLFYNYISCIYKKFENNEEFKDIIDLNNIIHINGNINSIQCNNCKNIYINNYVRRNIKFEYSKKNNLDIIKCSNCNTHNNSRPNIRLSKDDNEWIGDRYLSEYNNKYYNFLLKNKDSKLTILEIGSNIGNYDDDICSYNKEISDNIIFSDDYINSTIIRINNSVVNKRYNNENNTNYNIKNIKQSKVKNLLINFYKDIYTYENLLEEEQKIGFDIDEYIEDLKMSSKANIAKVLNLKMRINDVLFNRTINMFKKIRHYEINEYKNAPNNYTEIYTNIEEFLKDLLCYNFEDKLADRHITQSKIISKL